MDRRLMLTILALCIINVDSMKGINDTKTFQPPGSSNSTQANIMITSTPCQCPTSTASAPPTQPQPPPLRLGVFKAHWNGTCRGNIQMTYFNMSSSKSLPVCFSERVKHLGWSELCKQRGCGDNRNWENIKKHCYQVSDSGEVTESTLKIMAFQCAVVPDPELVGYKVVVSILCVLVLVVLIFRFGRPSLKAFRKKMSDRRQSRWIGPTQSQSVSYHRGKAGIQLNDKTDKRTSFPGLERLTVNNSREPSSNRNSDYDSYNL